MELEQKIDSLADNVIALAGQTEKRAKNAIAFVLVQARQRYLGTQLVVRRLRRIMALAGWEN